MQAQWNRSTPDSRIVYFYALAANNRQIIRTVRDYIKLTINYQKLPKGIQRP
jgi:hypothetical protein